MGEAKHLMRSLSRTRARLGRAQINGMNYVRSLGRRKYFCVGRNKTGTTSLAKAFDNLGFVVGNQRTAELIADKYYFRGCFERIVAFCRMGQVFQDVPFSWPGTFRYLDEAFPDSKFILTIRDDAETWYRSITGFHAKMFGHNGNVPSAADLRRATYVRRGFMYNVIPIHGTSDENPYQKDIMIESYERHNRDVTEYFSSQRDRLLVINLSDKNAFQRFTEFIDVETNITEFPWENRT